MKLQFLCRTVMGIHEGLVRKDEFLNECSLVSSNLGQALRSIYFYGIGSFLKWSLSRGKYDVMFEEGEQSLRNSILNVAEEKFGLEYVRKENESYLSMTGLMRDGTHSTLDRSANGFDVAISKTGSLSL